MQGKNLIVIIFRDQKHHDFHNYIETDIKRYVYIHTKLLTHSGRVYKAFPSSTSFQAHGKFKTYRSLSIKTIFIFFRNWLTVNLS